MNQTRRDIFSDNDGDKMSLVDNEIQMLVDNHNNHDSGLKKWTTISASNASSTPLIVTNNTGTNDISTFKDNATTVVTIADGGTTTITANAGSNKALVVNNGTSTGNILEAQDNGSAVLTVADGGAVALTSTLQTGGAVTIAPTSNQVILGTTKTTTISATQPGASSVYTIPDVGTSANFVLSEANQTINGVKTFAGQLIGKGTIAADSATAGFIGQALAAGVSATNAPTTTQYGDLTSISLTAGDWDVDGAVYWTQNGATWTVAEAGMSTTTGNSATGLVLGDTLFKFSHSSSNTTPVSGSLYINANRINISSTTIVYLKFSATYSSGTPQAAGRISARRVR